jgi:hypothetical protein
MYRAMWVENPPSALSPIVGCSTFAADILEGVEITHWGSYDRVNWTVPSLKVWVESSPTLHGKDY